MAASIFSRVARRLTAAPPGGRHENAVALDRAAAEVAACRGDAAARRLLADRHGRSLAERVEALTGKADAYAAQGRDDLAEAMRAKQADLERHGLALDRNRAGALEQEARLDGTLAALRAARRGIEEGHPA